jgi:hypothetical protein
MVFWRLVIRALRRKLGTTQPNGSPETQEDGPAPRCHPSASR